jgi:hypothetical protein
LPDAVPSSDNIIPPVQVETVNEESTPNTINLDPTMQAEADSDDSTQMIITQSQTLAAHDANAESNVNEICRATSTSSVQKHITVNSTVEIGGVQKPIKIEDDIDG